MLIFSTEETLMKTTWKITKTDLLKNNVVVAYYTSTGDVFSLRGFFGEVYGTGVTRREAAEKAIKDPRIGQVPRGATL